MIFSSVTVSGLRGIQSPAIAALSSLVCGKTALCRPSLLVFMRCYSMSPGCKPGVLHCYTQPSIKISAAFRGRSACCRPSHSYAQAKPGQYKLDTKVLEKSPTQPEKVLYTYGRRYESVFYNVAALAIFCCISYGSYRIYLSEDYEVTTIPPPEGDFPVFYKQYDLNPYRNYIAAGVFLSGVFFMGGILRHTLRCARSLVLLKDGETLAITTDTLLGSTRTRNVHHLQLRTEKLNYLLDDYDSCFLIRRGQLISYILEQRGVIHDPHTLKAIFAHSNDDSEVPPTERKF